MSELNDELSIYYNHCRATEQFQICELIEQVINHIQKLEADKQALEDRVKLLQKTFAHYYETNGEDEDCAVCGLNIRDSVHKRHLDGYFGNPMDELDKLTIKPQTD